MGETTGKLEASSSTYLWKIDHFTTKCSEVGQFVTSPDFSLHDPGKTSFWHLQLYPYGYNSEYKDYLSIFLKMLPQSSLRKYTCTYDICLMNNTQVDVNTKVSSEKQIFSTSVSWGFYDFIKRSDLFKKGSPLLKNDTLIVSITINEIAFDSISHVESLGFIYDSLFLSGNFSDLTVMCGNRGIKTHKAILSSHSKVLSAILSNDAEVIASNTISILEFEYDVVKEFLSFMYSRKIVEIEKFAIPLLKIADKYEVKALKLYCENVLYSSVTVENACEIVNTAEAHNCLKLEMDIKEYITVNMRNIMNTESFDNLLKKNPILFKRIFSHFMEVHYSKKRKVS